MSNSENEPDLGIGDEELPEDLQPGEENPLAEGLEDRETAGDLLEEGKDAEQGSVEGENAEQSSQEGQDAEQGSQEGQD